MDVALCTDLRVFTEDPQVHLVPPSSGFLDVGLAMFGLEVGVVDEDHIGLRVQEGDELPHAALMSLCELGSIELIHPIPEEVFVGAAHPSSAIEALNGPFDPSTLATSGHTHGYDDILDHRWTSLKG